MRERKILKPKSRLLNKRKRLNSLNFPRLFPKRSFHVVFPRASIRPLTLAVRIGRQHASLINESIVRRMTCVKSRNGKSRKSVEKLRRKEFCSRVGNYSTVAGSILSARERQLPRNC